MLVQCFPPLSYNLFSTPLVLLTSPSVLGVLPRQGLLQRGRTALHRRARTLLLHAGPGHGARSQRHRQAAPETRQVHQAPALLRLSLDPPQ